MSLRASIRWQTNIVYHYVRQAHSPEVPQSGEQSAGRVFHAAFGPKN